VAEPGYLWNYGPYLTLSVGQADTHCWGYCNGPSAHPRGATRL